jgi:hypothetical protein
MLKIILLFAVLLFAAEKQEVIKSNILDTLKVAKVDTATIVKHEEIKIVKTWRDTAKLVKVDTIRTITFDTLVDVRKVAKPVIKVPVKK